MALKEQLIRWKAASDSFDSGDYELSITQFQSFADTSKLYFNIGQIGMKLKDSYCALDAFDRAIELDNWLAIAYFQRGVVFYYGEDIEAALDNFQTCYEKLRGNSYINYTQLGLNYKLHESYVIFNIALCFLLLGEESRANKYFNEARNSATESDVDTRNIDDAIRLGNEAVEVLPYEIPDSLLFRPQEDVLKNAGKIDYLGKSKIVAGANATDRFNGFSGRQVKEKTLGRDYRQRNRKEPTKPPLPSVPENIERKQTLSRRAPTLTRNNTMPNLGRKNSISSSNSSNGIKRSNTTIPRRTSSVKNAPSFIELPKLDELTLNDSFIKGYTPSPKSEKGNPFERRPSRTVQSPLERTPTSDRTPPLSRTPSSFDSRYEDDDSRYDARYDSRYDSRYDPRFDSQYDDQQSDILSNSSGSSIPPDKIKVRIVYEDVRAILVPCDVLYEELIVLVRQKLKIPDILVRFVDEEGQKAVMANDDDLDEAIECSRNPQTLDLWAFVPV
jgi:hypothetical protein